jgi:hypothetical protein
MKHETQASSSNFLKISFKKFPLFFWFVYHCIYMCFVNMYAFRFVLLHMFCMLINLGCLCERFIIHSSHCISCIHYSHKFFYMKRGN